MDDLTCADCAKEGDGVEDQWETFEDIPLCDSCVDARWSGRARRGIGIPRDWQVENIP